MRELRAHQSEAITSLRQALAGGSRRPMLQAPTGAGKTVLAAAIIAGALAKRRRVIFTVPAISLIDQTAREFYAEGIRDVGVIQADHPMTDASKPVQIASVQTLQRRLLPEADLVIVDEAHRKSEFVESWMARDDWAHVPFIGLSATPWTKGLGRLYDRLIVAATTKQLIDAGYLSRFRVFAPSKPDLSGVRTVAGDYHEGDLSRVMSDKVLTADIVRTWLEKGEGRPTLCFAVDRVHAKTLQAQFEAAGVPTGYIDALTPLPEREQVRKAFQAGRFKVVCNVGVLTTGVDWDVRCIVLARPTKSQILYVQIVGRGLRTAEGKTDCIARDTLILTDRGEVRIQDITLDHKVWDGVRFVSHAGAICKGVQAVMTHDGLTATPDHRVMTNVGWLTLSEAHRRGLGIARTGMGGRAIRFVDGDFPGDSGVERQAAGRSLVRALWRSAHGALSQHQEATKHRSLSTLQRPREGYGPCLALSALPGTAGSLPKPQFEIVRAIWRSWDQVRVFISERSGTLGRGKPGHSRPIYGDRQDRQRRPLWPWKPALGQSRGEHEQHSGVRPPREVHCLSPRPPGSQIRGQHTDASGRHANGRRDHRAVECAFAQAEGEVWDILNAGPLQRFTANGRLVHNCLILDHSDTTLRLGFVTDIHHPKLCDGTLSSKSSPQDATPAKPRECPNCHYVRQPKVPTCPACGHVHSAVTGVETVDGELVELKARRKANAEADWPEKIAFIRQLRAYQIEKGKAEGWVAHRYKAKFSVWPNDPRVKYAEAASEITPEVRSWIKSQSIRYAKGHAKSQAQGVAA